MFQETQRLMEKKAFDQFSDDRLHQQVSSFMSLLQHKYQLNVFQDPKFSTFYVWPSL